MKVLKRFIYEAISSGFDSSGSNHMMKEKIINLQNLLINAIKSGDIKSQDELDEWWKTVEISIKSLHLIPFAIIKRM